MAETSSKQGERVLWLAEERGGSTYYVPLPESEWRKRMQDRTVQRVPTQKGRVMDGDR
jgi:hypothetical protein